MYLQQGIKQGSHVQQTLNLKKKKKKPKRMRFFSRFEGFPCLVPSSHMLLGEGRGEWIAVGLFQWDLDGKSRASRTPATEHLEEEGNMWSTCDLCLFVCLVVLKGGHRSARGQ